MSTAPGAKMAKKERDASDKSHSIGIVMRLFGIGIALVMLAPLVLQLIDFNTPALIRTAPLLLNLMFGIVIMSASYDHERYDLYLSFIIGALALIAGGGVVLEESERALRCSGSGSAYVTSVEQEICDSYPSQVYVMPIVAIIVWVFTAIAFVLLFFYRSFYNDYLENSDALYNYERLVEKARAAEDAASDGTGPPLTAAQRRRQKAKRLFKAARKNGWRWASMIINLILLLALIVLSIIAFFSLNSASYYRAAFLIPATMMAAAECAFLGKTPKGWIYFVLVLAILATVFSLWGTILDIARLFRCIGTPSVPATATETSICTDEEWLMHLVPWTLLGAFLISLTTVVLSIVMLVTGKATVAGGPLSDKKFVRQ